MDEIAMGKTKIEADLAALGYDGMEVNFRCILDLGNVAAAPYLEAADQLEERIKEEPRATALHALRGKVLSNLGQYDPAAEALKLALTLGGERALARAWLAGVYLLQGRFSEAINESDRALGLDPGCGWAYFYRAASRFGLGEKQAARRDLERILKLSGQQEAALAAYAFLGLLESQAGRFERALELLDDLVAKSGGRGAAYRLRALVHEQQGAAERAIEDLAGVIEAEGPRAELFLRRANLAGGRKLYAQAVINFEKALGLEPASKPVRGFGLSLARALGEEGKHAEAKRLLLKMAKRLPKDGEILLILAQHAERTGRAQEASRRLKEAAAALGGKLSRDGWGPARRLLAEISTRSRTSLADALIKRGKLPAAERTLRKALALAPRCETAASRLIHVLIRREKFAAARRLLRKLPLPASRLNKLKAGLAEGLVRRSDVLVGQERFSTAERALRKALILSPRSEPAASRLNHVLIRREQFHEAERLLRKSALTAKQLSKLKRALAESLARKSDVLIEQAELSAAEEVLRRALSLAPRSEMVVSRLSHILSRRHKFVPARSREPHGGLARESDRLIAQAKSLMSQGRGGQAEVLVRKGLALRPDEFELLALRAQILSHQGRLDDAISAYRRACALKPGKLMPYLWLGEALLSQGRDKEMVDVLRRGRREVGLPARQDIPGWLERYQLEFALLRLDEAARWGEFLLDKTRSYVYLRGLRNPFVGRFDFIKASAEYQAKALAAADHYVARETSRPWARLFRLLINVRLSRGAYANQRADIERLETFAPGRYGWLGYQIGRHYLGAGDFQKAAACFMTAAEFARPLDWAAQCCLAESRACLGDFGGTIKAFETAEKRLEGPDLGEVLAWKGEVLLWIGRHAGAIRNLDKAIDLGAHYAFGWKGGALVKLGRHAEALDALDRGIAVVSNDLEARIWRAEALYRLKRYPEALREASAAAPLNAFQPNLYFNAVRGLIHGSLRNSEGMKEDYRAIIQRHGPVMEWVKERMQMSRDGSDVEIRDSLEELLALSQGVRRGGHELAVWMR